MRRRPEPWLLIVILVAGCSPRPPECDAMCAEALDTVEACLDTWGLSWGETLGYEDPADHANWCATFIDEQLELATTRWGLHDGQQRIEATCAEQRLLLGDCAAYADSWDGWESTSDGP